MKHFRKIWDKEKDKWIVEHKEMNRKEAYKLFLKSFPDAFDVTEYAFYNERSRIGAAHKAIHGSTKTRPLYSEHVKKGYVRIKVAQPSVWKPKSRWVYEETHPWEDFSVRSNYIFLDGNNRNFNPDNIERVPLSVMGVFNSLGGCEKGNPKVTHLRILLAKLKIAQMDVGEKLGETVNYKKGRRFRKDLAEYARLRRSEPEYKAKRNKQIQEKRKRLKEENPEKCAEILRKNRERRKSKKVLREVLKNG